MTKFGGPNCAVLLGNTAIVKISEEGLEMLTLRKKDWVFIQLRGLSFFETSAAIALSESEIFVFGGYDEQEKGVKNSFVITVGKGRILLTQRD